MLTGMLMLKTINPKVSVKENVKDDVSVSTNN
jgi:hypothetical protein